MSEHDDHVRRIQAAYPKIWFACHVEHNGRRSNLTDRESNVLSHLSWDESRAPADLARHLGIRPSTLSEAVDKLVKRGLVERRQDKEDKRRVRYRLTAEGVETIEASSVLSPTRLRSVLDRIDPAQRDDAVRGLEVIAQACLAATEDHASREEAGS